MSESWIDPASMEGDALKQWYLRSPADVERARQEAAARRYQDFFYGGAGNDPDPRFGREVPTSSQDIDPGFAMPAPTRNIDPGFAMPAPSRDIDPGFTSVAAGPNRFRSVRTRTDGQSASPSPLDATSGVPWPAGRSVGQYQDSGLADLATSESDLTSQPVVRSVGELRRPPVVGFGPTQSAAAQSAPRAPFYGRTRPQITAVRAPAASAGYSPGPAHIPSPSQTIAYGALRAPAPSDQELAELRRQQAAFSDTTRHIDIHNSWFAVPALAPAVVALGLGAAGEWATGEVAPAAGRAVATFVERDPYLRVGDNWATRAGRRGHAAYKEAVAQKPDWEYEPKLPREGQRPLKPDLGTPKRNPQFPDKRKYIELKPDSPSGRAAGARALKKYKAVTDDPVRLLFYTLKDFI